MIAKVLLRSLPAVVLAGGLLFLFGAPDAAARSTCEARIDRKEAQLSNDVYHHGQFSYQANRDRAQLGRIHELCGVPAPLPPRAQYYSAPYPAPYAAPYRPPSPYYYRGY